VPLALWIVGGDRSALHVAQRPAVGTILGLPIRDHGRVLAWLVHVRIVLFLTRPYVVFHWMVVTGYVLAAVVYGSIGFVSVLVYVWFGLDLIGYTSPQDAWQVSRARWRPRPPGVVLGGVLYFKGETGPRMKFSGRLTSACS